VAAPGAPVAERVDPQSRLLTDVAILIGAFVIGAALAGAFGATNLGIALGVGQLTFMVTLMWVMLRR
jgi:hypothetical protein